MKYNFKKISVSILGLVLILFSSCALLIHVDSPKPTDPNVQVNGYSMDAAGHYIIKIIFNYAINTSTVISTKTLILKFSKDANTNAAITWSPDSKTATVTTIKTRDDLNIFQPDDHFSLTLIGTDAGNGVIKSTGGYVLDGDYDNTGGGDYVIGFTIIG